jgi:hypothetical protein
LIGFVTPAPSNHCPRNAAVPTVWHQTYRGSSTGRTESALGVERSHDYVSPCDVVRSGPVVVGPSEPSNTGRLRPTERRVRTTAACASIGGLEHDTSMLTVRATIVRAWRIVSSAALCRGICRWPEEPSFGTEDVLRMQRRDPARWDKRHRVRGTTNRGRIGASTITSWSSDGSIDNIIISIIQSNCRIANSPLRSSATVELVVGCVALPPSSALALPPALLRSDGHPSSAHLRTALQPRSLPPTPPAASRAPRTPWTGSSRSLDKRRPAAPAPSPARSAPSSSKPTASAAAARAPTRSGSTCRARWTP